MPEAIIIEQAVAQAASRGRINQEVRWPESKPFGEGIGLCHAIDLKGILTEMANNFLPQRIQVANDSVYQMTGV